MTVLDAHVHAWDLTVRPQPWTGAFPPLQRSFLLADLEAVLSVAVKLSGLVTEADWSGWTQDDLAPAIDHVLACFGAGRVMAGSDWPVCLLAAGYGTVQSTVAPALARLDGEGRAAVLGGTAARWYRIGPR